MTIPVLGIGDVTQLRLTNRACTLRRRACVHSISLSLSDATLHKPDVQQQIVTCWSQKLGMNTLLTHKAADIC